ncbi:MAG: patatin-like phospholipase family protein [Burkholderiaceae bacterium]|nr:patatin-like phospholipase family protein [Burkholderiaceae bacterium]
MKPIRIALSGSGFKFPAHVGALHAIRDAGFAPIEYAGTSGGSIIATLAACGMDLDYMKALTLTRDWSDMLSFSPWSLITNMGYCSGKTLQNWLAENTHCKTFKELDVDLVVMASDVVSELPFEFSKLNTPDLPVAIAARASASIPIVYSPVQLTKESVRPVMLMDGGMVNNIPIDQLTIDSVPRLGIQLVSKSSPLAAGSHSLFDIAPRVINLMMSSNENTHIDLGLQIGAQVAFVETGYAGGLDRNMSTQMRQRLFDDGYAATTLKLAEI